MKIAPIKKAASLLLCRKASSLNSYYNYQILMLQRKESMRSFNSVLAFPGGKLDDQIDGQVLDIVGQGERGKKDLKVSIGTVLRECFQETGLYIAKDPLVETSKIQDLNQLKLEYIANQFHKNSKNLQMDSKSDENQALLLTFLKRIITVIPPFTQFMPFLRLITVPQMPVRFDAIFYIHLLQQFQSLNFLKYAENQKHLHNIDEIVMNQQFCSYKWLNPLQVIQGFVNKKIKLAPPQFIMLNIMSNFYKFQEFQQFLKNCNQNQINIGPNVISLIRNNSLQKNKFPYAATLLGDCEFPFANCLQIQKNEQLLKEMKQFQNYFMQKNQNNQNYTKNRIFFQKPVQFFEQDYSQQCTIQDSVMSKFINSQKLRKLIETSQ